MRKSIKIIAVATAVCLTSATPLTAMAEGHHHQGNSSDYGHSQSQKHDGTSGAFRSGKNSHGSPTQVLNQLTNFLNTASSDTPNSSPSTDKAALKQAIHQYRQDVRTAHHSEAAFTKAVRQFERVILVAKQANVTSVVYAGTQGAQPILSSLEQTLPGQFGQGLTSGTSTTGSSTGSSSDSTGGSNKDTRIQSRMAAIENADKQVVALTAALNTATQAFTTLTTSLIAQLQQAGVTGSVYGNVYGNGYGDQDWDSNSSITLHVGDH